MSALHPPAPHAADPPRFDGAGFAPASTTAIAGSTVTMGAARGWALGAEAAAADGGGEAAVAAAVAVASGAGAAESLLLQPAASEESESEASATRIAS